MVKESKKGWPFRLLNAAAQEYAAQDALIELAIDDEMQEVEDEVDIEAMIYDLKQDDRTEYLLDGTKVNQRTFA